MARTTSSKRAGAVANLVLAVVTGSLVAVAATLIMKYVAAHVRF